MHRDGAAVNGDRGLKKDRKIIAGRNGEKTHRKMGIVFFLQEKIILWFLFFFFAKNVL